MAEKTLHPSVIETELSEHQEQLFNERSTLELQALALQDMYEHGEVSRQTIEIPVDGGTFRKEVYWSHKSRYAV